MQRTITKQLVSPTVEEAEPEILRSIRVDSRIRSVAIIRSAGPVGIEQPDNLVKTGDVGFTIRDTAPTDSFLVTDLLEDITYMVRQEGSLSQIVFMLNDEQVMVAVQPGSDLTEIAHNLAKHLATIRAHN
jgi:hypothetical protein